jgi:hypothetical protein
MLHLWETGGDAYRVFVRIPERKKQLGIPGCRWENNIRMDVQEVGCGGMGLNDLALDRDRRRAVVNAVTTFVFRKMREIS